MCVLMSRMSWCRKRRVIVSQSILTSIKDACTCDSGLGMKENVAKKKKQKKLKLKSKAASNYFSDQLPRKYARSNPFGSS